jgi:hypothetical protein
MTVSELDVCTKPRVVVPCTSITSALQLNTNANPQTDVQPNDRLPARVVGP